jgi:4-diphosphocytidyl-2-C-methyl-D-erythritol kinase
VRRGPATAKLNLSLVVGPRRADGLHELVTVFQRLALADRVTVRPAARLEVDGFAGDTLVRSALERLADAADDGAAFGATIRKRIPVAAGLGGGSSDAATALRLANGGLARPLPHGRLVELAAGLGADVPFFLEQGPQLGEGVGQTLTPLDLPQDYWVVLVLPHGAWKASSASVFGAFDDRAGERGFEERRGELLAALERVRRPRDLAALPLNDLAPDQPYAARELLRLGAFRADLTGAGPVVYGLFHHREAARRARRDVERLGRTWLTVPSWYV